MCCTSILEKQVSVNFLLKNQTFLFIACPGSSDLPAYLRTLFGDAFFLLFTRHLRRRERKKGSAEDSPDDPAYQADQAPKKNTVASIMA